MNYIILGRAAVAVMQEKYRLLTAQYDYSMHFDSYLTDCLSFDGTYKLLNRCRGQATYYLIGKNCMLTMELHKKYKHCFYADRVTFFEKSAEYYEKLAQTQALPGEWDVVQMQDAYNLDIEDTFDISHFLGTLKASYAEYYEFEGKWKIWDRYNALLKEREEKAEKESEREVRKVLLENNVFYMQVSGMSDLYREDTSICAQFAGEDRFRFLGKILSADRRNMRLEVWCDIHDILKDYAEKKSGKITKIRIVDFGALARLKRQREAMKILFQNEAANKNIRDIITGVFSFHQEGHNETEAEIKAALKSAYGMFGSNVRQKEAYAKAVSAPDIYLIQGPPGTGKTTIITEIVRYAVSRSMKILVSSETNIAVDNVLERIQCMDGIIPVRLGKAERIEESCISFMPEKIAESVLADVKAQNEAFEKQGVTLESLAAKCREKWQEKDAGLAREAERIRESFDTDCDLDSLLALTVQFEELVYEINDMYERIEAEKKSYTALKNKMAVLKKEKIRLQEQLCIEESGIMKSGLQLADAQLCSDTAAQKKRLLECSRAIDACQSRLSDNKYELLAGSYKRKMRRYERRKKELAGILDVSGSLLAAVHQAGNRIRDMKVLEGQRETLRVAMEAELDAIAHDYSYRHKLWEKSRDIRAEWLEAVDYTQTKQEIEKIYLKRTNAVFATCTGIASADNGQFADMEYDYVIIDEAAKCNMMDILIPVVKGKKIILVGDHKQLYPMMETEGLKDEISEQQLLEIKEHILFKWLYEKVIPKEYKIMLNRQYRMEKSISDFVSENFYDGGLLCEKERENPSAMTWIDCENSREELRGTSYINVPEAELVLELVKKLDRDYTGCVSVGIICTYKAQAEYLKSLLQEIILKNIHVECSTVDAFQGKEKHTIIFNTVRSSRVSGFICDENRINVAVSRAQEYVWVVGKSAVMKSQDACILGRLYHYIRTHGVIRNDKFVR